MSNTITIEIDDKVAKYVDNSITKFNKSINEVINELLNAGFEQKFSSLYKRYQAGEISLGWLGQELGLSIRDVYDLLEKRKLPFSAGIKKLAH